MPPMYAVIEEVVGSISLEHGARDKILNSSSNGKCSEKVEEDNRPSQVMNLSCASLLTDAADDRKKELQEKQEKAINEEEEEGTISSHCISSGGSPNVTRKRLKSNKRVHRRLYGVRSTLLDRQHEQHTQKDLYSMASSESSSCESYANPLLETINVLTYDPCDDSDDYYDFDNVYEDRPKSSGAKENAADESKGKEKALSSCSTDLRHHAGEGDRESIGYAGSNSIDSGYKSFCPTPEMPDPSVYGPQAPTSTNPYALFSDSSIRGSARSREKPKIMMGTKLISRQNSMTLPRDAGSRRSDSSLYEVNLDHLMYLRQSLLSVIQKCESSTSKCAEDGLNTYFDSASESSNTESNNGVTTPSAESKPTIPCPTYQKTVRFEADVKVSTLNNKLQPDESSTRSTNQSAAPGKRKDASNDFGKRFQSKSILKDPLCENLRSKLESGSPPDCTLEEEIDSLLYGRAEFYDLENVQDFPCSYVTMIEEKYRNGKPSLAKVRKLKGNKNQEPSKVETEPESKIKEMPEEKCPSDEAHKCIRKDCPPSSSGSTMTISTKCRFTEVAKCMIEIIEDLQLKKLQSDSKAVVNSSKAKEQTSSSPCQRTAVSPANQTDGLENASQALYGSSCPSSCDIRNDTSTVASCYASSVDYHVYEEIAYDFIEDTIAAGSQTSTKMSLDVPPPLPARPTSMWQKANNNSNNKFPLTWLPSPPSSKNRQSRKTREEGSVRNRPKQRSNLYSLFADKAERRNISRSLEREWRVTDKDDPDDEYGFRKVFPSV